MKILNNNKFEDSKYTVIIVDDQLNVSSLSEIQQGLVKMYGDKSKLVSVPDVNDNLTILVKGDADAEKMRKSGAEVRASLPREAESVCRLRLPFAL